MSDICQLCCEENEVIKCSVENTDFMELFRHFVFNNASHQLDSMCISCFQKLDEFIQFCENIRNIHQSLIEESVVPIHSKDEEQTEELVEEIEENTVAGDDGKSLSIQISPLSEDFDPLLLHKGMMTPDILRKLENQTKFTAKAIKRSDMNFDRISRFVPMKCSACNISFESFDDCNDHYLTTHGRSAYWQCCNLILETPYELLDHIRYHESIDVFKCAACHKCFLSSNKLRYHIHRTHLTVDTICIICDRSFRNLRLLFNHHKSHILISCPNCDKEISAANYDNHIRASHTSNKRRRNKTENVTNQKLQRTVDRSVSNEVSVSSINSIERTNQSANMMFFAKANKPNDAGLYECDKCPMKFKQTSLLFSHRNKVHV